MESKLPDKVTTNDPWVRQCVDAFYVLNMHRANGVVPLTDIIAYAQLHQIANTKKFLSMFYVLNNTYLNIMRERNG